MPLSAAVRAELEAAVGADQLISEPEQLRTYNCDGLTGWRAMPELVVLAGSTAEVQRIVARELPVVPLWYESVVAARSTRLEGYELSPYAAFVGLTAAEKTR